MAVASSRRPSSCSPAGGALLVTAALLLVLPGTLAARGLAQAQDGAQQEEHAPAAAPGVEPLVSADRNGARPADLAVRLGADKEAAVAAARFTKEEHIADELIVKLKPQLSVRRRREVLARGHARAREVLASLDDGDLVLARVDVARAQVAAAAAGLEQAPLAAAASSIFEDSDVQYVAPNHRLRLHPLADWSVGSPALPSLSMPNDPNLPSLWGMSEPTGSNAGGANATGAWAAGYTSCDGVVIGVIDEGIDISHPDLAANIWVNPRDAKDGADNDKNGYKDDVNGWDFVNGDATVYHSGQDEHGTHVSGTIGGVGNNGIGVTGVCWSGVKIASAKFLGPKGGTSADAIRALNYFTQMKKAGVNVVATSNSWGGGGFNQAVKDAIDAAGAANILFIAASGNSGVNIDTNPEKGFPAAYDSPSVVAVGAVDQTGRAGYYSNFGYSNVDIFAPGSSIVSTLPDGSFGFLTGTSMATPHVTGAAALYAAAFFRKFGSWPDAAAIKSAIMSTGTPNANAVSVSGCQLNIGQLLASLGGGGGGPPPPPSPPPSPSPPRPSPSPRPPGSSGSMRAVLTLSVYRDSAKGAKFFSCQHSIRVVDKNNQDVPSASVQGKVSITKDIEGITDLAGTFPYTVYGTITQTSWTPLTPNIPTRRTTNRTTGTKCVLTITNVQAAGYVWDKTTGTNLSSAAL